MTLKGDAKLELFPGARPPDTTFTSWYDLTLALVWTMINHQLQETMAFNHRVTILADFFSLILPVFILDQNFKE